MERERIKSEGERRERETASERSRVVSSSKRERERVRELTVKRRPPCAWRSVEVATYTFPSWKSPLPPLACLLPSLP